MALLCSLSLSLSLSVSQYLWLALYTKHGDKRGPLIHPTQIPDLTRLLPPGPSPASIPSKAERERERERERKKERKKDILMSSKANIGP